MDFFQKNQKMILILVLFGGAFYAYTAFFKPDSTITASADTEQVGNEVLTLYNSLQSVTLDQNLFSSKLYTSLVDFSTTIPQQNPGRPNPFAEIGRD